MDKTRSHEAHQSPKDHIKVPGYQGEERRRLENQQAGRRKDATRRGGGRRVAAGEA